MANPCLITFLVTCLCFWATAQAARLLDRDESSKSFMQHMSISEEAMALGSQQGGRRNLLQVVPPTVTSVTPVSQSNLLAGGTTLTITGTLFATGATVTIGGTTCATPTTVSATSITCTAPAKSTGSYAVVVTNSDTGYSVATAVVVIYQPVAPPTVTAIYPVNQYNFLSSGTYAYIYGTMFATGATVTIGGTTCPISKITSDYITCITPAMSAGDYAVVVTNADTGYSVATSVVANYQPVVPPRVYAVSPVAQNSLLAGGTTITIRGDFVANATVKVGTVACSSPTLVSSSFITCVAPAQSSAGSYAVVVTNADTGYSVTEYLQTSVVAIYQTVVPPTMTAVSPVAQNSFLSGGTNVTITGTSFAANPTVKIGAVACTSPTFVSATSISCVAPAQAAAGSYAVVVTNADTGYSATEYILLWPFIMSVPSVVAIYQTVVPPTVTSVTPVSQSNLLAGGTTLTITGTLFATGATDTIGFVLPEWGLNKCKNPTIIRATSITCVAPAQSSAGSYAVVVTNSDTGFSVATSVVVIYQSVDPPTVTSVTPLSQSNFLTGGTTLTITGTLFATGATVTIGGTTCATPTTVSATSITCTAPAKSAGRYAVVVTNSDTGYSVATTVLVVYQSVAPPTVTAVTPASHSNLPTGGTTLTITGTLFATGATVTIGGSACTSVSVASATSITCTAPAKSAGSYAVVVTNSDTGYSISTTVVVNYQSVVPPTVTAISPVAQANLLAGGTTITITGTLFAATPLSKLEQSPVPHPPWLVPPPSPASPLPSRQQQNTLLL